MLKKLVSQYKVVQLVSGRFGIQTQVVLVQRLIIKQQHHSGSLCTSLLCDVGCYARGTELDEV